MVVLGSLTFLLACEASSTTDATSTLAAAAATSTLPGVSLGTAAPAETVPTTTAAAASDCFTAGDNSFGGDDPADCRMPNVVCMNLQRAQDEIQDHGVFYSRSVDATGEGRRQVIDSNWVVIRQTPAAGAPIDEGEAVLYVVKLSENNSC